MAETGKSKGPHDHARRAAEEFAKAADTFAEHAVPPKALAHLREAMRHMLQAGISALDEVDRRARGQKRRAKTDK